MQPATKHFFIISFDCLSTLDFPLLQELPHFHTLLQKGAYADKVEAIYPSVTYPSHATNFVTGNYPARHGITSNTLLQPGRSYLPIGIGTGVIYHNHTLHEAKTSRSYDCCSSMARHSESEHRLPYA